jgi:hypothetical protein
LFRSSWDREKCPEGEEFEPKDATSLQRNKLFHVFGIVKGQKIRDEALY